MEKHRCRSCHTVQGITTKGVIRTHNSKYTKDICNGSMRPGFAFYQSIGEEPKDYPEEEEPGGDCFSGLITTFIVGVVVGLGMGVLI